MAILVKITGFSVLQKIKITIISYLSAIWSKIREYKQNNWEFSTKSQLFLSFLVIQYLLKDSNRQVFIQNNTVNSIVGYYFQIFLSNIALLYIKYCLLYFRIIGRIRI